MSYTIPQIPTTALTPAVDDYVELGGSSSGSRKFLASTWVLTTDPRLNTAGTVESVQASGGATGLSFSGGPITVTGTLTLGGTLAIASGGTGLTNPALVAGNSIVISNAWPNQTVALSSTPNIGTATGTSLALSGDISGAHFVSTVTDGTYQYRLIRTGTDAREYGLAVSAANGEFLIDDITAGVPRLRISTAGVATVAGGLVGTPIGASSPSTGAFTTLSAATSLAVNRSGTTAPTAITTNAAQFVGATGESLGLEIDTFAATPFIYGRRAAGVAGTPTATQSGNNLLAIQGNGYGTTGYPTGGSARILFQATENFTDSATGGAILLQAAANGSLTLNTVASITSTGLAVTGVMQLLGSPPFVAGSVYLNSNNGLTFAGNAGSNHDFVLTNSAGSLVLRNPTGGVSLATGGALAVLGALDVYNPGASVINIGSSSVPAVAHTIGSYYNAGASFADLNLSAKDTIVLSSGAERGRFSSTGLAVTNRVTVNGAGATLLTTTTGTLSTTGKNYWSLQDDVAGITTERGWVGYGNGDGTLRVINTVGNVQIGANGVYQVFSSSGLAVTGAAGVTSFTGSTQLGLRVVGATSTNDYSGLDFSTGTQPARARIASYFTGAGSYLVFGTSNNYGTGVTNSALTIDYNGVTTLAGGLVVTGAPPSFVAGSLYFNATDGLTLGGKAGSSSDFLVANSTGSVVLRNPTGTTNVVVNGTVTATSFSGPLSGDASAATSKPTGTDAVLRSFAAQNEDVFNVKDFGATGGGSVDDAAAIQKAVDAAVTKTRAVVYFPSGRYVVGTAIDTDGNYGGRISFVGAGEFGSVLIANTAGMSVFSPTLGAGFAGVEFRHLSFETAAGITANACVTQTTVSGSQSKVVLDSLLVSGDYVNGFLLSQVGYGKIDGVDATASISTYDTVSGAGSGSAISLTGYCLNNVISNVRAVYWKNGLLVGDGTNTWQGLEITNFNTVYTVYGIKMTGQSVSPDCGAVQMSNVEIDAGNAGSQSVAYGIWSNYVSDIQITNSTTYTNASGAKVGVYMANRSEAIITNMRLVTSGSASGIQLVAMSNVIVSDILQGGFTNTVSLDASCSYCRVRGAQTLSSTAPAVSDSGANNSIECTGSLVWDPGSLTPGQQDTTTLSVPGVVFGSTVSLGVPYDLQGLTATASVYTTGVVRITVYNSTTSSTINLGSGTWRIRAITPGP